MPLIPFSWMPGHWGLRGLTRELAKIDYEHSGNKHTLEVKRASVLYTGTELERHLIDIDYNNGVIAEIEYDLRISDLIEDEDLRIAAVNKAKLKHGIITQRQYDEYEINNLDDELIEKASLDLLLKYNDITQMEYDKQLAIIDKRPWFHFDIDYVNSEIELEIDYNEYYIEYLRSVGYGNDNTATDDDIIDEFVRDFGRKISGDHPEEDNNEMGMSFIKSMREANGLVSYK